MIDLDRTQQVLRESSAQIDRIARDGSIAVVMIDTVPGYHQLARDMWGWDGTSLVWRLSRRRTRQLADFFGGVGFVKSFIAWLAEPKPGRVILFMEDQIQAMQGDPRTGELDPIDMMPDGWCPPGVGN